MEMLGAMYETDSLRLECFNHVKWFVIFRHLSNKKLQQYYIVVNNFGYSTELVIF